MKTLPNIADAKLRATWRMGTEGIHVDVTVMGIEIDRKDAGGWLLGPKHQKLAERLCRAVNDHKAMVPVGIKTDINGKTYLDVKSYVHRTINADLNRLGY